MRLHVAHAVALLAVFRGSSVLVKALAAAFLDLCIGNLSCAVQTNVTAVSQKKMQVPSLQQKAKERGKEGFELVLV